MPLKVLHLEDRALRGAALVLVRPDNYVAWTGDRAPDHAGDLVDKVRGASAGRS
jgi:hypothetical protein